MLTRYDGGTTSPTLLGRVADWRDLAAWQELFLRYDPLLKRWCRAYLLDDAEAAEVAQRIWVELADRLISFRYDPRRPFRGWLRSICRSRSPRLPPISPPRAATLRGDGERDRA